MLTPTARHRTSDASHPMGAHHHLVRPVAALGAVALATGFVVMAAPPATALEVGTSVFPAVTGGFQIDGNLQASVYGGSGGSGSIDWNSATVAPQPLGTDPIDNADTTVFTGGSKESDYNGWDMNGSPAAPPKADVGNYYFHSAVYDVPNDTKPHLFVYFGFERVGNTGTVYYNIELNQKTTTHENPQGVTVPDRTAGDLLIALSNHGSGGLTFHGVSSTWTCPTPQTCSWSDPVAIPDAAISGLVNDTAVPDPFASKIATGGTLDEEQFAEIGLDLSALFTDGEFVLGCPSEPVFGQISMRSRSSEEVNSELKDMIGPLPVHLRDLCGGIRIEKTDGDHGLVPGATFLLSPNPTTGQGSLTVVDGGTNDLTAQGAQDPADGVVEFASAKPGTYTVSETAPPPGWIGDSTPQTKGVVADEVTTFEFVNHLGVAMWQKVDADTGAHLGGATFVVHRTSGLGEQLDITVTDQAANDLDLAQGYVKVIGLKTGTYTVTETEAPNGYNLPADATQNFTISAENSTVALATPFRDPRKVGYLHIVKKLVDSNGEPFSMTDLASLDGTTFVVYADNNENGVLDPGEEVTLWASDAGATCTISGGTGACDIGPLTLGDYRIAETNAPSATSSQGDVDVTVTESSAAEPIVVDYTNKLAPVALTVVKDGPDLAHVGDTVTYTFAVTNSGTTDLVDATVVDPICDEGTLTQVGNGDGNTILAVGETWNWTCTRVVLATDPDPLPNTVTATGHDARGRVATDTDDHVIDLIHPAITLVKTADNLAPSVGDTVTFTYVVTNTGDTTLYNVTVTDDILGAIGSIASLAPGASATLTATEAVTADTPATNVGTAKGTDVLQKEVTDTDTQTLTITAVTPPLPPTPPETPTSQNNPPPPATGATVAQPMAWALGLMLAGALSIATSRRRRPTEARLRATDGRADR